MAKFEIAQGPGGTVSVDDTAVESLRSSLRGGLLKQGDEGYDEARTIWNAMIDRKPALIARCTGLADVQASVRFASEHNLLTAIRGGGHNIAGNAVCDGGFMIDLSQMSSVRIDPAARRAHVGPGATLGDVDHEAQAFGLAVPTGINSTTGIAGLTLGGGFGWLSRKHGLTLDCLVAADVVTSDGKFVRASNDDNQDLFWAIRGGGGNFGVVTRFEYELFKVGPMVLSGLIVLPLSDAKAALTKFRDYARSMSDDSTVWVVMRQAPPLPFLPEDVHGKEVLVFALCHIGDAASGQKVVDTLRSFGTPHGEFVGEMPFAGWQQVFDALLIPGARNYWKSHNFDNLDDGLIDTAIEYTKTLPSPQCEIFFAQMGGATNRKKADSTAYPHRDANYVMNVHGRWDAAADDEKCIDWSRKYFDATSKYASGGVYINFMTADETTRVDSAFGGSLEKLKKIKQKYDPKNLFRMNQNISPRE